MAKKDGGFSEAEREAMKERAAELRAEKGGKKKADNLQALLDKSPSWRVPTRRSPRRCTRS